MRDVEDFLLISNISETRPHTNSRSGIIFPVELYEEGVSGQTQLK